MSLLDIITTFTRNAMSLTTLQRHYNDISKKGNVVTRHHIYLPKQLQIQNNQAAACNFF